MITWFSQCCWFVLVERWANIHTQQNTSCFLPFTSKWKQRLKHVFVHHINVLVLLLNMYIIWCKCFFYLYFNFYDLCEVMDSRWIPKQQQQQQVTYLNNCCLLIFVAFIVILSYYNQMWMLQLICCLLWCDCDCDPSCSSICQVNNMMCCFTVVSLNHHREVITIKMNTTIV